jgi:hypothetical protein
VAYSHTLVADGTPPITFEVTAGALPDGLTLSGAVISGTPTTADTFTGTITATNSEGTDTQDFSIVIAAADTRPNYANLITDIRPNIDPDTQWNQGMNLDINTTRIEGWNDTNGEKHGQVVCNDAVPGISVPVSTDLWVYIYPDVWTVFPATEFWVKIEINLHRDDGDTVVEAQFGDLPPDEYAHVVCALGGGGPATITGINIRGGCWTNSGQANIYTITECYITSPEA